MTTESLQTKLREEFLKLEKALNNIDSEFVKEYIALYEQNNLERVTAKLQSLAEEKQALETAKVADLDLQDALEKVKLLKEPYNAQDSSIKKKARFIGLLMQRLTDNF